MKRDVLTHRFRPINPFNTTRHQDNYDCLNYELSQIRRAHCDVRHRLSVETSKW